MAVRNESRNGVRNTASRGSALRRGALEIRPTDPPQPDLALRHRRVRELLDDASSELPPGQRRVFELVDRQGLGAGEVAELLGLSVENVRKRLTRARRTIRRVLGRPPTDS